MARLTEQQKEQILSDFHIGKSQNELAKMYRVSPATINKICKGITPKHVDNVNTLTRIKTELASESECQVNAIHRAVDERTKHIQFFNHVAVKNVQESMAHPCENQNDFRARAQTIREAKEVVLGKSPDVAVQINNNNHPELESNYLKRLQSDFEH